MTFDCLDKEQFCGCLCPVFIRFVKDICQKGKMFKSLLLFVVLVAVAEAFFRSPAALRTRTSSTLQMLEIKADGKVITVAEKEVNLRKALQANKVDVYPLRAKITGNCGGAGICGTCAVQVRNFHWSSFFYYPTQPVS